MNSSLHVETGFPLVVKHLPKSTRSTVNYVVSHEIFDFQVDYSKGKMKQNKKNNAPKKLSQSLTKSRAIVQGNLLERKAKFNFITSVLSI